jgi:branched-chain amino acid transport system permease protein
MAPGFVWRERVRGFLPALLFFGAAGLAPLVVNDSYLLDTLVLILLWGALAGAWNVAGGYAGQVSLGHQGIVGIGAFTSAVMVRPSVHASFLVALPVAGLAGAAVALLLGMVALRIRGLYLALLTLGFGVMAQNTILNIRGFTGAGAGAVAPRPAGFHSNQAYAYLCLLFLGLFLLVDWRMARTKAGRAFTALRIDERKAAVLGIPVIGYKLLAFCSSGFIAGVAGSLFAHQAQSVFSSEFDFATAVVWVLMAVVGGLGSRSGIVIASAFFALLPSLLVLATQTMGFHFDPANVASYTPFLASLLALAVLVRFPAGVGGLLAPITRWLSGGPLREGGARPGRPRLQPAPRALPAVPGPAATRSERAVRDDGPASTVPPMPGPTPRRGLRALRRRSSR